MAATLGQHRSAAIVHQLRWFHRVGVLGVGVIYVIFSLTVRPAGGFFGNHFTDCLAGIALPCALLSIPAWEPLFRSLFVSLLSTLGATLSAAVVWEVLVPLVDNDSVGDPWDVVAYLVGALVYWVASEVIVRRLRKGPAND
ncbi:MAG: hypothetical protein AAFQ90_12225 [Pseudomonadota bacterium]